MKYRQEQAHQLEREQEVFRKKAAATTAKERLEKAAGIDERLVFREKDGLSHALRGIGKVVGLAVGGCAELSSTVHRLAHLLATQGGERILHAPDSCKQEPESAV